MSKSVYKQKEGTGIVDVKALRRVSYWFISLLSDLSAITCPASGLTLTGSNTMKVLTLR